MRAQSRRRAGRVEAVLLLAVITARHARGVSSSEAGSTFANGKSRRDAFIGYTETRSGVARAGDERGAVETAVEVPWWCHDDNESECAGWAKSGECTKNPAYMSNFCRVSCGTCTVKRKKRARDGPRVFLDITVGREGKPGRIVLDLFAGTHPRTSENFRQLCVGTPGWGYKGGAFHRVIPGFMNQAGGGPGSRGSIYGGSFKDESFAHKHDEPFLLSMANGGPDTNGDQFFITVGPTPHLDGKHVVFGTVVEGVDVVMAINQAGTPGGMTKEPIVIVDAGEITDEDLLLDQAN